MSMTIDLDVLAAELDETNPPTDVLETAVSPNRQGLAFGDGTDQKCAWSFRMPDEYSGGNLSVVLECSPAGANTSKTFDYDVEIEAHTPADNDDLGADSYDTANNVTNISVPDTADQHFTAPSGTLSNVDSVAAGDLCRLRVTRKASTDDAVGDINVWAAQLLEA